MTIKYYKCYDSHAKTIQLKYGLRRQYCLRTVSCSNENNNMFCIKNSIPTNGFVDWGYVA